MVEIQGQQTHDQILLRKRCELKIHLHDAIAAVRSTSLGLAEIDTELASQTAAQPRAIAFIPAREQTEVVDGAVD